jgi:hypothetical protein
MKYLKLKFENAKLFTNKRTKDKIFDGQYNIIERKNVPFYVEPVTINQISNMLHVLFNERPVPINRYCGYKKLDYYNEMAKNSYFLITTSKIGKGDKAIYPQEIMQIKKSIYNSWSPIYYMNWEVVKQFLRIDEKNDGVVSLNYDLYTEFLKVIKLEYNIYPEKNIFTDLDSVRDNITPNFLTFLNKLKKVKKTALTSYFLPDPKGQYLDLQLAQSPNSAITVTNGVEFVIKVSGEIVVPVTDEDIEKLQKSKGCATLLDSGLVYISKLVDETFKPYGYTLVNELSLKTY